jgi:hypothetical protein
MNCLNMSISRDARTESGRWFALGRGAGLRAIAAGALALGVAGLCAPAQAQPAYGSYIGVGVGMGQQNDRSGGGLDLAGVISGRYKLLESPISIRAQALFDSNSVAVVPTVSYDIPVSWQLEPYIAAGISVTTKDSIIGDKTAFVLQPGLDYAIPNSRLVVFGNAMFAFDAYKGGKKDGSTAISVQTGLGWRF